MGCGSFGFPFSAGVATFSDGNLSSAIVPADRLRGYVIDAIGRGVARELVRTGAPR